MIWLRWISLVVVWSVTVSGADFATKLPVETRQLVESFDCFSKRDKMALYGYALALQYRMDHIKDTKALEHGDLDYWRLSGMVSDVANRCMLANLRDAIDGILTPTPDLVKRLKRLHWVESGLPQKDGWSESSERMRTYDKKLLDTIMAHPPQWTFAPKNPYLHDYNLTTLKQVPKQALLKKVLSMIDEAAEGNATIKQALTMHHWINEQMVRAYDLPKIRLKLAQQKSWVDACLKRYQTRGQGFVAGNFHRSLVSTLAVHSQYYPVRSDFLPKELDAYCEHNITEISLDSYVLHQDKPVKTPPKPPKPTFGKTKALLKNFAAAGVPIQKYQAYLNLSLKMLNGGGKNLMGGLRLIRLQNCLASADANRSRRFLKTLMDEAKDADLKSEFTNRVLRPQMWWMMTIGMKLKQEGETEELKHFFDCNATQIMMKPPGKPKNLRQTVDDTPKVPPWKIISQRDEILKYYAATFVGKPTPDMTNAKAVKSGIIAHKYLDGNGTAIKPFGDISLEITGMPKGGIKLTYRNVPKGKICQKMMQLSFGDTIFYNHKTYAGLDYALIDGHKVRTSRHYNGKYAWRLCAKQKKHTISYVKEETMTKRKHAAAPIGSTCNRYAKTSTIDTFERAPYGTAVAHNKHYFVLSGIQYDCKSGLYDASIPTRIDTLPESMDYNRELAVSENGERIVVLQTRQFSYWDTTGKTMAQAVKHKDPRYKMFLLRHISLVSGGVFADNVLAGIHREKRSLSLIDPIKIREILTIHPHIFLQEKKRKYGGPEIMSYAFSPDKKWLYIGTNRKKIEVWHLTKGFLGFGSLSAEFDHDIVLKNTPKIGAMLPDPRDPSRLYIAGNRDRVFLYDMKQNKTVQTYVADYYMQEPRTIQVSDDGNYLLVSGFGRVLVWKIGEPIQWDVLTGDGLKGATFRPKSDEIITISKNIEVWKPSKRKQ